MSPSTDPSAPARFRGVFPVLVTPFDDSDEVDTASLERCVAFSIRAGADGLVALVNASESTTVSDSERHSIVERVVGATGGQVPVVVGVTAATARQARTYAAEARALGADAVIAMPPILRPSTRAQLHEYFAAIARGAELPVFIQNYHGYPSAQLPVDLVSELVCAIESVDYVKEEVLPPGQRMTQLLDQAGPCLHGVMGGLAGRFMIDEYLRGACGTMPACEIVDVHVAIWRSLERGDLDHARDLHARALPLLGFEWLYGPAVYKEVLRQRGVISTANVREPGAAVLDARDRQELASILARLADDFSSDTPIDSAVRAAAAR